MRITTSEYQTANTASLKDDQMKEHVKGNLRLITTDGKANKCI